MSNSSGNMRGFVIGAATGVIAASASMFSVLAPHLGLTNHRLLPDPQLTPGNRLPVTTAEICEKGYAAKARHVTKSDKDNAYKRYHISTHKPGDYEIDHLISLELGGSNSETNLWPQSYHGNLNAHDKDKLENKLHQMVCEGLITLEEAQRDISENWIEAYEKYISN